MITPVTNFDNNIYKYQKKVHKPSPAILTQVFASQRDEFVKDVAFTGIFNLGKKIRPKKLPVDIVASYLTDYRVDYNQKTADEFVEALGAIKDVDIYKPIGENQFVLRNVLEWLDPDRRINSDRRLFATHLILEHLDKFNAGILEDLSYNMSKCYLHEHELENLCKFIKDVEKRNPQLLVSRNLVDTLYKSALEDRNKALLKVYSEDLKLPPGCNKTYEISDIRRIYPSKSGFFYDKYLYNNDLKLAPDSNKAYSLIEIGRANSDPELSEFFDDKHLYEIMKKYPDYWHYYIGEDRIDALKILGKAFYSQEKDLYKKYDLINQVVASAARLSGREKHCSDFPVAPFERRKENYLQTSEISNLNYINLSYINRRRVENIIERNVLDKDLTNPANLLKCLNDVNMSPELLTKVYNDNNDLSLLCHIASIPVASENKVIMSDIVKKIKDMGYFSHAPILGKDETSVLVLEKTAELAARNNNVELLEYFKSLHLNLNKCLKLDSLSEEVKAILKNVKLQNRNLPDFATFTSPEPFRLYIKQNPQIDINSRDYRGEPLLLKAIENGNSKIVDILKNIDDVDWNITDSTGKNAAMYAIDLMKSKPEEAKAILEILRNLPEGKFDINYINYCVLEDTKMPVNALTYFLMNNKNYGLEDILSFKNLDVNNCAEGAMPPLFIKPLKHWENSNVNEFKELLNHKGFDLGIKFNGKTLREYLYSGEFPNIRDTYTAELYEKELDKVIARNFVDKMKTIYDKEGSFTLEQIKDYLNFGKFDLIKDKPLNILGDKLIHFIPEITGCDTDYNTLKEVNNILEILKKNDCNIDVLNDFGDSALRKAVEMENIPVVKLLIDFGSNPKDLKNIIKIAKGIEDPELNNLLENLRKSQVHIFSISGKNK